LPEPFALPWPALMAAFALTEVFVLRLQVRRESLSISVWELPLVIGLVFCLPDDIVLARLVGAAVGLLLFRRQFGTKVLFTLAQLSLQPPVAVRVSGLVLRARPGAPPAGWLAVFVAPVAAALVGSAVEALSARMPNRQFRSGELRRLVTF